MSNTFEMPNEEEQDQRSRMLAKLEMVWNSNPHLTFLQLIGFITSHVAPPITPRGKSQKQNVDDFSEGRIDLALKSSGDEKKDIFGRWRPGHEPLPVKADLNAVQQAINAYIAHLDVNRGYVRDVFAYEQINRQINPLRFGNVDLNGWGIAAPVHMPVQQPNQRIELGPDGHVRIVDDQ